jgi:ribosomal protein L24E
MARTIDEVLTTREPQPGYRRYVYEDAEVAEMVEVIYTTAATDEERDAAIARAETLVSRSRLRDAIHAYVARTAAPAAVEPQPEPAPVAPAPRQVRRNSYAGTCSHCGRHIGAGTGELYRAGGWRVRCLDREACATRAAEGVRSGEGSMSSWSQWYRDAERAESDYEE